MFRFRRRGSSAGQSARLIIVRSRVRAPPPLPTLYSTGRRSDETKRGKQPWQASLRTFAPRSLWPARSARSATTSPRRTVVTRRIVSNWRSTARAATSRRRTARPADGFTVRAPRNEKFPGAFSVCAASLVYAVRMSESYDIRCRVGTRQIVAPISAGEARIPALVRLRDERLILFFDERPAPASGTGADFNGLTMASDLPNPNRIRWMERDGRGGWSDPRELPTGAPPSRRTPAWGATAADSCTWRSPRARGRRLHGLARGR